tara:strand:+ start:167 stop:781 length:615 start_codon:yes stop_codon:yes gene_type:complete
MIQAPNDYALIREIKEKGCNESYEIICERHEKLFFKICQKYIPIIETVAGIKREEVLDDKHFVMFKAVNSFKNDKETKFSTWLGNCTKYHCLNFLNSNKKLINCDQDFINQYQEKNELPENAFGSDYSYDVEFVFNILKQLKDKRIAQVFRLRYFGNFGINKKATWSRIAREIKTSTQTAINLHKRGQEILVKKMKSVEHMDIV